MVSYFSSWSGLPCHDQGMCFLFRGNRQTLTKPESGWAFCDSASDHDGLARSWPPKEAMRELDELQAGDSGFHTCTLSTDPLCTILLLGFENVKEGISCVVRGITWWHSLPSLRQLVHIWSGPHFTVALGSSWRSCGWIFSRVGGAGL